MEKNIYSIGEVSKIKDITIKALRFYDRIGLFKPYRINPSNQYRYYHISQFIYMDIIKAARALEISPNDLIPFFQNKDTRGVLRFLNNHKEQTRKKIKHLESIVEGIEQIITTCSHSSIDAKKRNVYLKHIPDRHVIVTPYEKDKTEEEYTLAYSELDITVSRLGLFNTYETGLLFTGNDMHEFYPSYLFTTISGRSDNKNYRLIPGRDYFCVCYNKNTASRQQQKLQQYLLSHNHVVLDLVQVELLTDIFNKKSDLFELEARVGG